MRLIDSSNNILIFNVDRVRAADDFSIIGSLSVTLMECRDISPFVIAESTMVAIYVSSLNRYYLLKERLNASIGRKTVDEFDSLHYLHLENANKLT